MMISSKDNIYTTKSPKSMDHNSKHHTNDQRNFDSENCLINPDSCSETFLEPLYKNKTVNSEIMNMEIQQKSDNHKTYKYGWGFITTKHLQIFNKPIFFLLILCLGGVAQGLLVTGVSFTVITSIEKQFGLKSTEVGLFGTIYDVAYGCCCIIVGYLGHKHKPRFLGWGLLFLAIGAFVFTIPKYLIGPYFAGVEKDHDYCSSEDLYLSHECTENSQWFYKLFFFLGNIIMGIGATPIYILGPAHIDEITTRGQGSLYLGIFFAAAALGPGLGFVIGLPILNTWVDINQPPESNLTPMHRNWIGAWWIGYLLGAVLLLLPVLPMLGFARLFPNSKSIKAKKLEQEDTIIEKTMFSSGEKSLFSSMKNLFKNPSFMFICLASASESLTIGGFSTFLPKFVETQFHFTSGDAALYTGLIVLLGAVSGIFLGGYLIKRLKWNCKQILKAGSIMAFIAIIFVCCALVGCDGRQVVAPNSKNNPKGGIEVLLNQTCNNACACSTQHYKPICSVENQRTYFSPCHAGCDRKNFINGTYINCSCFTHKADYAIDGRCTPECQMFPLFAVVAFLFIFFTFMNNVPMLSATFRVVPEGQGSFAMGFQEVFVRFLGFIPAPVVFGSLIDESCELWQIDDCTGASKSCLEYNNEYFRYYIFALGLVTKSFSFIFIYLAYRTYKLPSVDTESKERLTNGNIYRLSNISDQTITT